MHGNTKVKFSWFILSTLNYDARSTTHQITYYCLHNIHMIMFLQLHQNLFFPSVITSILLFSHSCCASWYYQRFIYSPTDALVSRSQWPRGLRPISAVARLLRLWVRNPSGPWKSVCCECCVLSSSGLCDWLIIRPAESYRMWCVFECDLETSWVREPWTTGGSLVEKEDALVSCL